MKENQVEQAAKVMVDLGWRSSDLTQYCIRGIAEELGISVNKASKLYRKVLASGVVFQEKEARQEAPNKHYLWGGFGKQNIGYMRWVWTTEEK